MREERHKLLGATPVVACMRLSYLAFVIQPCLHVLSFCLAWSSSHGVSSPQAAYTDYDRVHHTPLGRFSMLDISIVGGECRCQKGRRWNYLAENFPKTYRSVLGLGTLLVLDQSSLRNAPEGCDIHRGIRHATLGTVFCLDRGCIIAGELEERKSMSLPGKDPASL